MKKILIVALAVFTLTAQSCKKKKTEPEPPSAKELLTQDDWTWREFKRVDNNGNIISQTFPNTKFVFSPSGDYYVYDVAGNIFSYGTWEFLNDDTKIRLREHNGTGDFIFDIDKLENDKFEFSRDIGASMDYYYLDR